MCTEDQYILVTSTWQKVEAMSGFNHIRVEVKGDMLFLFFNRPRVKNAIAPATYLEIVQVLKSAEDNDDIRAVVLSGTGDYFTSGADISFSDTSEYKASMRDPPTAPVGQFMFALMRFPKLLVAAVNGPAVGIGVTLLTHCDFCYAATSATFWTPFVRVAVVPEFCSSMLFPRIFGTPLANEMLLGARVLKVEEAKAAGLIAAVFPNDRLLAGWLVYQLCSCRCQRKNDIR